MADQHEAEGGMLGQMPGTGPTAEAIEPRIVVPLDGSEGALTALPVARGLAQVTGATIHLLHVSEQALPLREVSRQLGLTPEQMEGVVLDELTGEPAERIAQFCCEPGTLLVMASRSNHGKYGLGEVSSRVLELAGCPIVLVRRERGMAPWCLQRMLLPHDGSPVTAAGFRPAVRLAQLAEATVFVLHVATLSGEPTPGSLPVPPYVDQPHLEWPEWSLEFLERMDVFTETAAALQPRLFLSKGDPGQEILRFARERGVDLIAVSWHGTLELRRAGTLKEIIDNAPCPVFFAKAPEEEPAETQHRGTIDLRNAGPFLHS
ncbi:MAG: universal stress protein [Myxococcales bacterium]|jgi:nucleotide-binding universal stress UspA family protein